MKPRVWLKPAVSALLLGAMVWLLDVRAAFVQLTAADPVPMVAACALFSLTHVINALKLLIFLPDRQAGELLRYTLAAQGYALLLPGQLAGEAVKAYRLGVGSGRDQGEAAAAVAFDKLLAILSVLIMTLYGLAGQTERFGDGLTAAAAFGAAALVAVGWLATLPLIERRLTAAAQKRQSAAATAAPSVLTAGLFAAARFFSLWRMLARRPGRLAASLAAAVVAQATQVWGCQWLGLGLGVALPFDVWCVVIGGLTAALLVPISLAGLGVRELSLIGLLGAAGATAQSALSLAMAILAFQIAAGGVGLAWDGAARKLD